MTFIEALLHLWIDVGGRHGVGPVPKPSEGRSGASPQSSGRTNERDLPEVSSDRELVGALISAAGVPYVGVHQRVRAGKMTRGVDS
jgi:hypothetical protein